MLKASTIKRKIIDILNHATKTQRRAEELPEVELVKRCAPRYHERVVDGGTRAGHLVRFSTGGEGGRDGRQVKDLMDYIDEVARGNWHSGSLMRYSGLV
jgi:hypothetical protein